jgi:hypothetical protein
MRWLNVLLWRHKLLLLFMLINWSSSCLCLLLLLRRLLLLLRNLIIVWFLIFLWKHVEILHCYLLNILIHFHHLRFYSSGSLLIIRVLLLMSIHMLIPATWIRRRRLLLSFVKMNLELVRFFPLKPEVIFLHYFRLFFLSLVQLIGLNLLFDNLSLVLFCALVMIVLSCYWFI